MTVVMDSFCSSENCSTIMTSNRASESRIVPHVSLFVVSEQMSNCVTASMESPGGGVDRVQCTSSCPEFCQLYGHKYMKTACSCLLCKDKMQIYHRHTMTVC